MRLDSKSKPWSEAQIERAAKDIEGGHNITVITQRMRCSKDHVRNVLTAAKGEEWWASHVRPSGRRY